MSGLYIHLPFCASRCIYCGFYSTTLPSLRDRYIEAAGREMALRRSYLNPTDPCLKTIYLGGGTPSQLSIGQLQRLFHYIEETWSLEAEQLSRMEITMECNPDDLTPDYVEGLRKLPVNRISMGIQTFSDSRLTFLHRRHTASEATEAVRLLQEAGFSNISIDLMFGFPGETVEEWKDDLRKALSLGVQHISAYSLTYEEGTPLYRMLKEGKIKETDEETSLDMYRMLMDELEATGFEHYEISNFAQPGFRSRHNSSYWQQTPYIGIGAAAHSYDLKSRQWNCSSINHYIEALEAGKLPPMQREELDESTRYDDLVTTALRTREGLSIESLSPYYRQYLLSCAQPWIESGRMEISKGHLRITRKGIFVSDDIMSDLMHV